MGHSSLSPSSVVLLDTLPDVSSGNFVTVATPAPTSEPQSTDSANGPTPAPLPSEPSSSPTPGATSTASPSPTTTTSETQTVQLDGTQYLGLTTGLVLVVMLLAAILVAQMKRP